MVHGIQCFQAPQLFELSSSSTGGMAALKDMKKRGNSNFKSGIFIGGRSWQEWCDDCMG
jgi:hypothetical protein